MEKFLWLKILCSCMVHFSFPQKASTSATGPVGDFEVHLNISEPYLDVKVNDTIYIKCSGSPPLEWEYESPVSFEGSYSKQVSSSNEYESIVRLKFHYQDATGRYRCRNNYSETSIYIFVNGDKLILSDPYIWIYPENAYVGCLPTVSGMNMTLWLDSELVPSEFDPTKGFLIKSELQESLTMYECLAEHGGQTDSEYVFVEIFGKTTAIPLVTINNANATYVTVGSSFSLTCSVRTDVHAFLNVTWSSPIHGTRRKESETHHRDETYLLVNRTLLVLKAEERDSGSYQCRAKDHSQKENFAEVIVKVYATPPPTVLTFLSENEELYANKNEKIQLTAPYEVFPPTSNIPTKWSKDDQPIVSNFKHTALQTNSSLSLIISDLNGHDSGLYTVTANASGCISKKSFLLRVKDQPFVNIISDPSCCFYPGQKYNLSCEVIAYPPPSISWSWKPFCFNDRNLCNSSTESNTWIAFEKYYEVNNSTAVTIPNKRGSVSYLSVVGQESGFYKCNAENEMGATEAEKLFAVSDAEKGFEIICTLQNPEESTEILALCKASSVLYSDLQWKRISVLTSESRTVSTAKSDFSGTSLSLQAELKEISESENETYICSATLRNSGAVEEKSLTMPTQGCLGAAKKEETGSGMKMDLHLIPILGIFLTLIVTV